MDQVQGFIGTKAYKDYKAKKFKKGANLDLSSSEAFIMKNKANKEYFSNKFEEGKSLYYDDRPSFDEIIKRIADNIKRL